MLTNPSSPLLQKKASMLPIPGEGGVGGIDVADRDSLARHTLDDPADPANNYNPFYGKGTELDSLKSAAKKTADNSICRCGHQWHEHWSLGSFGCKDSTCECKGFKARTGSVNLLLQSKRAVAFDWDKDIEDFRAGLKQEWDDPDGYLYRSEVYCPRCGRELIDELIDTQKIGMPEPGAAEGSDWTKDSEMVPQPILSLEPGTETCAKCGDDLVPETRQPGELSDQDREFLKSMNILASLKGLSQRVKSANPLLNPQPPDPETATFFKESEGDKPHCPHCSSDDYALMPTDFETAKCNKCGKNWNHGIVKGINDPKTAAAPGPEGFSPPQRELDYTGWSTIANLRKYVTELYNAWLGKEITRKEYEAEHYLASVAYEAAKAAWTDPKYRELAKVIDSSEGKHDVDFLKSMGVTSSKTADSTSKSYGMGTPLGGASNVPAPNNTQEDSMDPLQKPQDLWKPPDTAKANTAPEQQGDQIAQEVVKQLQEKVSNVELSQVVRTDEGTDKPGRSDIKRHIDKSLLDKDYAPPIPLSKGAGVGEEDDEGEVTDLGTRYGKPIGKRPDRDEWGLPTGEMPEEQKVDIDAVLSDPVARSGWKWRVTCPECGISFSAVVKEGPTGVENIWYKHWTTDHRDKPLPPREDVQPVPYKLEAKLDQPVQPTPSKGKLRFTQKDKDFLKGMGIKGSKVASVDAETWWKNTINTKRRELAGSLGIDKYWSHFVWESLPLGIQELVKENLPKVTEPQLELTPENKELLGGTNIQAAGKNWNPVLAKKFYEEGLEAAKNGDWNAAAKALSQSLNHNPYNGPAHFMMGLIFAQDGDASAALEQLQASLRTSLKENYPYHGIITEFERRGELDGIPEEVRNYLLDNMVAKTAAKKEAAYSEPDFKRDDEYNIDCTGDVVVGDEVRFQRAVFSGNFRKPKFSHFEEVTGKITKDSYGDYRQQHTFTLELADGSKTLIKGRNLYRNGCWRKPWMNEEDRQQALDEKHSRGESARADRNYRRKTDRMMREGSDHGEKTAVQVEEGVNLVCPNCKGTEVKPVDDPESDEDNLVECARCSAFFTK
jgi:tetratricopeptide (TPR) repeat protein